MKSDWWNAYLHDNPLFGADGIRVIIIKWRRAWLHFVYRYTIPLSEGHCKYDRAFRTHARSFVHVRFNELPIVSFVQQITVYFKRARYTSRYSNHLLNIVFIHAIVTRTTTSRHRCHRRLYYMTSMHGTASKCQRSKCSVIMRMTLL